MAGLTGPTHGKARGYYAGLVTTKAWTDKTTALAAFDRSLAAIIQLVRSNQYDRIEIPSGTAPGGHGLGSGLAANQNGSDQPAFQEAITRALGAIHMVAAEVSQRRAVTATMATDATRPSNALHRGGGNVASAATSADTGGGGAVAPRPVP